MQSHKIKAVVFDMDGLMIDTEPIYQYSFKKAAEELGYTFEDAFFYKIIGKPDDACKKIISEYFGSDFPLEKLWSRWPAIWRERAETNGIARKPGLEELFSFLDNRHIPRAVATSSAGEQAAFSLSASGLDKQFSQIVTGDQVENGKPAPDIYLEAARRLGVEPENCIALEDSDTGIQSAYSAGMTAIMVPDMKPPSAEARVSAAKVVSSLFEAKEVIRTHLS